MTALLSFFFQAATDTWWIALLVGVACATVGAVVSILIYKEIDDKKRGSAKEYADSIVEKANIEGKQIKKDAILEAKEEIHRLKADFNSKCRERSAELTRLENKMNQKEEALDKREDSLIKRLDQLDVQQKALQGQQSALAKKQTELEKASEKISQELERVASLTKEEAKQLVIDEITSEARKSAAVRVREIEAEAKEQGERKAKEIIATAIQRCASETVSESTITTVPLPNDEVKGRLIGREGRNIRSLENATGVELIIDDTPEVVILSGFDPVRRQIARITIEKLLTDGRIHPARIEETVEKVKRDIEITIKDAGEAASFDTGVFGLHPELLKYLGRLKFRTSYGQNVLQHSCEVAYIAGIMASELGLDVALAKRGALLHDIGKSVDQEIEGTHMQIGADLAKKYKESPEVVNCIMSHHGDVEPMTVEAVIVAAADAVSGARPGARRESLENYIKRLEKLEEIANSFPGVQKSYAVQAGREIRVAVKPEEVNDETTVLLAKDIAQRIENEMEYPGQIKVNVIRETRSVEFAK
ncbi:MAG: ribonuclease Y [Clostridia bacterium]|nr:ribonuclease Y [Clostridia bacterium]